MYRQQTHQSNKIHGQIRTVCDYLRTRYSSKKHGGFNIYEDDKILAVTDTCVPNVDLSVKVDGKLEHVFGCSYHGDQVTYHPGKWEQYLSDLDQKALAVKQQREEREMLLDQEERAECERAASEAANKVFA